jgi:hypothetical protein
LTKTTSDNRVSNDMASASNSSNVAISLLLARSVTRLLSAYNNALTWWVVLRHHNNTTATHVLWFQRDQRIVGEIECLQLAKLAQRSRQLGEFVMIQLHIEC